MTDWDSRWPQDSVHQTVSFPCDLFSFINTSSKGTSVRTPTFVIMLAQGTCGGRSQNTAAEVQHEAPALQLKTHLAGWDGRL